MLTTEVAARLERKLGLGAFPLIRRRMFQRLQRLAVAHGDPVLEIIAQVEMEALGPKIRDKGQYFTWVVKRRLGELGFPLDAPQGPPPTVPPANMVKEVREKLADATKEPPRPGTEEMRAELVRRAQEERFARWRAEAAAKEGSR